MSEWKMKRFWTEASVAEAEDGFRVTLDGRQVRTPAKSVLSVPTQQLAAAIAEEWLAQSEEIDPNTMPLTRLANSAQDKVRPRHAEVAAFLAEYGASDLLCYRADAPNALIARQDREWGSLLDWFQARESVSLIVQSGVMPIEQPASAQARISDLTTALDAYVLTGFHELVTISGSWVIAYSALLGAHDTEVLWQAANLDELWQAENWGEDEEALQVRANKGVAFRTALRFLEFLTEE